MDLEILHGDSLLTDLQTRLEEIAPRLATPVNRLKSGLFLAAWQCQANPLGHQLRIIVGRDRGDIVLIWPFVVTGRAAIWLGVGHSYREIIVERNAHTESWIQSAWEEAKAKFGTDLIWCPFVRGDNAASHILHADGDAVPRRLSSRSIKLTGLDGWEAYEGQLDGRFRRNLRQRERRLGRKGGVHMELMTTRDQIVQALDWTIQQKVRWAERTEINASLSDDVRSYYRTLALNAFACDALMFAVLKLDDAILATSLAVVDETRLSIIMATYDRAWKSYAPGNLLYTHVIRWAFPHEIQSIDLGPGNEPYKQRFAKSQSVLRSYVVPCSFWGNLYVMLHRSRVIWLIGVFRHLPSGVQTVARRLFGAG